MNLNLESLTFDNIFQVAWTCFVNNSSWNYALTNCLHQELINRSKTDSVCETKQHAATDLVHAMTCMHAERVEVNVFNNAKFSFAERNANKLNHFNERDVWTTVTLIVS